MPIPAYVVLYRTEADLMPVRAGEQGEWCDVLATLRQRYPAPAEVGVSGTRRDRRGFTLLQIEVRSPQ